MPAGIVKFVQGAEGTSLPADIRPGSIYIIERDSARGVGDMYVDLPDGSNRVHIVPDVNIPNQITMVNESNISTISEDGKCYVFNQRDTEGNLIKIGVAVGDGTSYIGNLPVVDPSVTNILNNYGTTINNHTTAINTLKHTKINAYLGTEYLALNSEYKNADIGITEGSHLYDGLQGQNAIAAETLVLTRELWL